MTVTFTETVQVILWILFLVLQGVCCIGKCSTDTAIGTRKTVSCSFRNSSISFTFPAFCKTKAVFHESDQSLFAVNGRNGVP